mgnify:CR=1 FL=1|tara:strand:- start:3295 stop:4176 length:882 start_codon:yes stop_codon:yes gene_type:complete
MKNIKSRFWYSKNQRNGILFLLILIISLQLVYHFVDFSDRVPININKPEVFAFQNQIDSLKEKVLEKRSPKIFPFNPNYITDYKGYKLGMSPDQIDRLLANRKKGLFVNSVKEFQLITKVSDSLLNIISPYFKFPEWITKKETLSKVNKSKRKEVTKTKVSTTDLNLATQNDFKTIYGVGEKISERIIKYRTKLKGFSFPDQIYEVWGLNKEVGGAVLKIFTIKTKPKIQKININTATFKEVLSIPYIDYNLCKKIFEFRDEVAELQLISELKNIEGFPLEKYDRIVLYLLAE